MAAFAKTHPEIRREVIIRPVIMGPVFLLIFGTVCVFWVYRLIGPRGAELGFLSELLMLVWFGVCMIAVANVLRLYHRSLALLAEQVGDFSVQKAECFCCTVNHRNPETKKKLLCDRKIVESCINFWFGSVDAFDSFVHRRLSMQFHRKLGSYGVPYKILLLAGMPSVWAYMDMLANDLADPQEGDAGWFMAVLWSLEALAWWLCVVPSCVAFLSVLSRKLHRRYSNAFMELATNALVSSLFVLLFLFMVGLWYALSSVPSMLGQERFVEQVLDVCCRVVYLLLTGVITRLAFRRPTYSRDEEMATASMALGSRGTASS
eukprot:gnl/TRDRNA2_/TRDRNA2_75143_c0_seq2.p1 gnl/TRDRNA2_/TRDRNA2_75143_c0~~gnl/TRDRNA2_/TRDRNA2_75143_c0_seq2.p1  ORF type:complete len:375 (-),score=39.89 gnl/TRDRNA2_/TRDRNA2_75143_c0_seq2:58-1014(-)